MALVWDVRVSIKSAASRLCPKTKSFAVVPFLALGCAAGRVRKATIHAHTDTHAYTYCDIYKEICMYINIYVSIRIHIHIPAHVQ